jgi:hypothetical protein
MSQHARELPAVEQLQKPRRDGDGRMLRRSTRREGLGRVGVHDVQPRPRQVGTPGHLVEQRVEPGQLRTRQLARAVHGQRDPIAEPVRHEVHRQHDAASDGEAWGPPRRWPSTRTSALKAASSRPVFSRFAPRCSQAFEGRVAELMASGIRPVAPRAAPARSIGWRSFFGKTEDLAQLCVTRTVVFSVLPVSGSRASILRMPSTFTSKVSSTFTLPAGPERMPPKVNSPSCSFIFAES